MYKRQERVEEAEDKIKLVKKWTLIVEQEIIEYRGPAQQLDLLVQSTLLAALEDLDSRINSLEAYLQTAPQAVDLGLPPAQTESPASE